MSRRNLLRKPATHKGDYGHVLVIAGSLRMAGASILTSEAALRSGAGKVTLAVPDKIHPIIQRRILEAMTFPLKSTPEGTADYRSLKSLLNFSKSVDAVALGPGLGVHASTKKLVKSLILKLNVPIVLDADGINCLRGQVPLLRRVKNQLVLTPHPGELAGLVGISAQRIQKSRKEVAKRFSADYDCTLLLKGHGSIVAEAGGKIFVNSTGNPGMASGGMGDVLTGLIASFIAQGFDPFFATRLAVYIHGKAGDMAAKTKSITSLLARDVLELIPSILRKFEGRRTIREVAV